jgi:RNase P/RNase MRP subunit p29
MIKKTFPLYIGKNITIVKSLNSSLINIEGKVIDETINTVIVESKDKIRRLLKSQITVKII